MDINNIVSHLEISNYIGTLMSNDISGFSDNRPVCAMVNLQKRSQSSSHWTKFYRKNNEIYYFDCFGVQPPDRVVRFLKTKSQYVNNVPVIKACSIAVQADNSNECGSLCINVLYQLSKKKPYDLILNELETRLQTNPTLPLVLRHV